MMALKDCPTCGKLIYGPNHRCNPIFLVRDQEYNGDEWEEIRALNHDEAAQEYAGRRDRQGDYDIINGMEIVVEVREVGATQTQTFEVTGRSVPEYYAHRTDG